MSSNCSAPTDLNNSTATMAATITTTSTSVPGKAAVNGASLTRNVSPAANGTSSTTPKSHTATTIEHSATSNNNSPHTSTDTATTTNPNMPASTKLSNPPSAFSIVSPIRSTLSPTSSQTTPSASNGTAKRSETPVAGSLLSSERLDEDDITSPSRSTANTMQKRQVAKSPAPSVTTNWSALEDQLYGKLQHLDFAVLLNHIKGLENSAIDLLKREEEEALKAAELRILDLSETSPVNTPRKLRQPNVSPLTTNTSATITTTTTTQTTSKTEENHTTHDTTNGPNLTQTTTTTISTVATSVHSPQTNGGDTTSKLGSPIAKPAEAAAAHSVPTPISIPTNGTSNCTSPWLVDESKQRNLTVPSSSLC
eukprot:TRINITY_DN8196_c0_g1_i1.p1 TRINITY_DN8196_c0_g1~~TRINITY_DN8196_c0_g1_i1.p1  ORF type:complete len:367 (+),score=76.40 TRINITY_DN8196_c0_g1_i1:263-1363(+)